MKHSSNTRTDCGNCFPLTESEHEADRDYFARKIGSAIKRLYKINPYHQRVILTSRALWCFRVDRFEENGESGNARPG